MSLDQEPGTTAQTCGHEFVWTDQHPRIKDIRKMLHTHDLLASDALDRIDVLSPPGNEATNGCPMAKRDMYALLEQYSVSDETIGKLWNQVTEIPHWVDWEQICRGQKLVYQYHGQMQLGHFVEVVESLDSVKPHGKGFASSVRVRLLHAKVRRRIMRLWKQRPAYYDMEQWGVPINDLHQVATIVAYSANLVFISLPRMGIFLTEQQISDYLALWRWVGHIMGTPVDWMATPVTAKAMMEAVLISEMEPSANSQIIANNIITAHAGFPPWYASRHFLAALAYRLNGDELALALNIDAPSAWHRGIVTMQLSVANFLSSSYVLIPKKWQERRDRNFIQYSHNMVTNRKIGGMGCSTIFEFQYIPQIGMMTEKGKISMSFWQRTMASVLGALMLLSGMISLYI
ncbi:hypothetical protein K4F52_009634 [Lecanicillium sp. MT-2017a]|nr:hypothetical protein K4F52_009634 [Lecanicillium sp. MT-2017a]